MCWTFSCIFIYKNIRCFFLGQRVRNTSFKHVFERQTLLAVAFLCLLVFSGHQRQHPVLPDHRNEHGERDVSDVSETVPGTV